jgi:hypothetical protein
LLKLARQEVIDLENEWKNTEKENKLIYEFNANLYKSCFGEITAILDKNNVKYKLQKSIFSKSKKKYETWFDSFVDKGLRQLSGFIPYSYPYCHGGEVTIDGHKLYNGKSPTGLLELYDYLTVELKKAKNKEKCNENHFIECVKQAAINNINILNLTKEEIIDKVEAFLKNEYMKSNYPDGKTINIDDNYCECETFTIGNNRCSCGHRRIGHWVNGNCLNGYYLTVEPY